MANTADKSAGGTPEHPHHFILGTAGHIDHGKTSLIRALTGIDTDRLPEEKRRGMTIELGFAFLQVGDIRFGIVDVPGHEKFIKTMVAGATGIDLALLVVAADDSVMPQTIEHVDILELLGISCAIVAVTKADLVDPELAELVEEEVVELLAPTGLAGATVVRVSSTTGAGLDELRAALSRAVADLPPRRRSGFFRIPVDRVFTVAGRGTVVTGSVFGGRTAVGDTVEIHPAGLAARIRGMESHGEGADEVHFGQRAAVNLMGIDKDQLARGMELAEPGFMTPSSCMDARVNCLGNYGSPLASRARVRVCLGAAEVPARLLLLGEKTLPPGGSCLAQLRFAQPAVAGYGQRFVLREENASRTIGGGIILRCVSRRLRPADVAALSAMEQTDDKARVLEVLRFTGFDRPSAKQLACRAGVNMDDVQPLLVALEGEGRIVAVEGTEWRVPAALLTDLFAAAQRRLEHFHRRNPDQPGQSADAVVGWLDQMSVAGLGRALFQMMVRRRTVKLLGKFVCLPEFAPAMSKQDEKLLETIVQSYADGAFKPPTVDELTAAIGMNKQRIVKLVKIATAIGRLVEIDGEIYLHEQREREMRETVRAVIAPTGSATLSEIREALDSSRKYAVPLMEYLDRIGFTQRDGDKRTLGTG